MNWKTVNRPGYLGGKREATHKKWNEKYGKGNWRLVWKIGELYVGFLEACALYEDAYYEFLKSNPDVLSQLIDEASDVYDDAPSNVESAFDYSKQETNLTHVQDIAIRRSVLRMGLWFTGKELLQIRGRLGKHPLSTTLSPGRIPFHLPDLIEDPELQARWWKLKSVESFYQSNRYLQVKEG